jgi:adenylate kinase family enzyme
MERALVVGPPCSGKTTTARVLASGLRCTHTELDELWWEPNWTEAGAERFRERVLKAVSEPRWVLDGNYFSVGTAELVLPLADTIVWLDRGRWVTVPRGMRRTLRRVLLRTELWSGNREPLSYLPRLGSLAWSAIRRHPHYNAEVEALRNDPLTSHARWVRLKSKRSTQEWLDSVMSSC